MLESMGCTDDQNDAVQATSFPADGSAEGKDSEAPRPNASHCCACIHNYPGAFKVAIVRMPLLGGFSTAFPLVSQPGPDRHPQPLVPPPIA
jgi:hypothetical protein